MATIIRGKNKNRPYTVRYVHEGRQRERSFRTSREANDFKIKFEHDNREQIFVDPAKANEPFRLVAARWLAAHQGRPKTLENYEILLRNHINPAIGGRGILTVSRDREAMLAFLTETMPGNGVGPAWCKAAYVVVCAVVNYAVKSGQIPQNRISGLRLPKAPPTEFVFPTQNQIRSLALAMPEGYELSIYLMRGCGLRVGEALGVRYEDLQGTDILRLRRQLAPNGTATAPLKHRGEADYRDVPVPHYVAVDILDQGVDTGPVFPSVSRRQYGGWFTAAKAKAGIEGHFTPHSLRHAFASACLAGGIPITDVSHWLGHQSIQTTFSIYGHLVPSSFNRAVRVLEDEWAA